MRTTPPTFSRPCHPPRHAFIAIAAFLAWLVALCAGASAETWYVAPHGTPDGRGTRESPWDIESALAGRQTERSGRRVIRPGDTIELLAGTYRRRPKEQFEVKLAGEEGRPIVVRAAAGQRVTIDGGLAVTDPSSHLWVRDLEILVSEPNPDKAVGPGSHPPDFKRPWGGLNVHAGRGCKFINLVIHDCRQGVSWWKGSTDSELYGCIIYDNGWPATDRGHGHAVYTQNDEGTKTIADNLMTGGFSYTMHAYGSSKAYVNNYRIEGNVCYECGPFLIGGGRPSHGIAVIGNYLYGCSMRIGYTAPHNEDCEVRDNLVVNGGLSINNYRKVVNEGNTVLKPEDPRPAGAKVVLRPNRYDPGRANVIIFNWEKKAAVKVDAGAVLRRGERYRLMNPRDFYGKPVLEGVYDGTSVDIPTGGEFAAFVLLRQAGP